MLEFPKHKRAWIYFEYTYPLPLKERNCLFLCLLLCLSFCLLEWQYLLRSIITAIDSYTNQGINLFANLPVALTNLRLLAPQYVKGRRL